MQRFFLFSAALVCLCACSSTKKTNTSANTNVSANTNASTTTNSSTSMATNTTALNTLTDKEKSDGWQLLFDGTTTNGWHTYGKENVSAAWSVQDGAIHLNPAGKEGYQSRGGGDMVTNSEYDNYDLQLDWKISPQGNSGVIFYLHDDPATYKETWNTGMEMQVLDNGDQNHPGHPDAKIIKHRAGDLYDLITSKEAVKPVGEWNHVELVANQGKLDFYLNGVHTLSTTMWDDNWRALIAGSKFKDMPTFGTYKSGKIALQDHGNEVWFRNIKIRKL